MASLSVDPLGGGRYKIRWREWVEEDGVRSRRARAVTVSSKEAATELQATILRALETVGYYEPEARVVEAVADLELAAKAWLEHKAARGCSASTIERYAKGMNRWFLTLRELRGLGADDPIPVSVLSREILSKAILAWRQQGLSESTRYGTARMVLDMWTWVADDPETYPGMPSAPRDKSAVLPQPPVYTAPTTPTLAEVDACIRQISRAAYVAQQAAIVMRFTGLRISQVLALQVRDVDLVEATMTVRLGKSRHEKAEQRTIPISRHLVAEIAPWVVGKGPEDSLVRRRRDLRAPVNRNHMPGKTLSEAWEAATAAGEARREVWAPVNRELARPEHAFRAAFQGHLEAAGVRDAVIDKLVGHAPRSTRGRHYAPSTVEQLREAVELLPARMAEGEGKVVRLHGR